MLDMQILRDHRRPTKPEETLVWDPEVHGLASSPGDISGH